MKQILLDRRDRSMAAVERQAQAGTISNAKVRGLRLRNTLVGFQIDLDPVPERIIISQRSVENFHRKGWLALENPQRRVHFAGGVQEPERRSHNFLCADKLIFRTIHGDYVYEVTHQPGKYIEGRGIANAKDIRAGYTCRVDHFFVARLMEVRTDGRHRIQH